jgi:high-affinity nickel permease
MDINQIVIIFSLLSISTVVIIVGIYLIKLIKELRVTVNQANQIISSVSRPVSSFSEFLMGFKNGFTIFNSFFNKDKKKNNS